MSPLQLEGLTPGFTDSRLGRTTNINSETGNLIRENVSYMTLDPGVAPLADARAHILVSGLIASHGTQLRRFLLSRVRNGADAHDIAQEVYLRMLRVPDTDSIRSPEAYLFTVAQHVLQQHTLRQSMTPPSIELNEMLNSPAAAYDTDPALAVDAQQCLERLQRALEELSPKARATFMLHRRDGLSFQEIGEKLGISCPMVKKYLMKALLHLHQRVQAE